MPALQALVNGLHALHAAASGGHVGDFLAVHFVADADRDLVQFVEHVELSDDQRVDAIHRGGVAGERNVEPAAAARATRHRAELFAHLADLFAERAVVFAGEGSGTDAGDVGLGDADDAVDFGGRHAGAGTGAAGGGAGRGDEGVSAVVNVQHGSLGTLEQNTLAIANGAVEQRGGVGDERGESRGELFVLGADGGKVHHFVDIEGFGERHFVG